MKFTKDGYLGVVAASDDCCFDYPINDVCCDDKKDNGKWEYSTAGIIIHNLNKEWDESFILLFPLKGIDDAEMKQIECGVAQYLINKGVPILDYYSHLFYSYFNTYLLSIL